MLPRDALLSTLLVLGVVAHAALLTSYGPDAYYRSVQEDEYLEWATFWAFAAAAVGWFVAALRTRRADRVIPWFATGLGLFCLFVALEEISWGQRVFAYQAPRYFLEHNYQLELNLHNLVETSWRKWALYIVIAGYGIVLPLVCIPEPARRWLLRFGVASPPVLLAPVFVLTLALYLWYPWSHTGESVELMLGLGFLFAALPSGLGRAGRGAAQGHTGLTLGLTASFAGVVGLGFASAEFSRLQRGGAPENVAAAEREATALGEDFLDLERSGGRPLATRCGLHKRVHSYVEKYGKQALLAGRFAQLTRQGMPQDRADFLLDPWNSPYWIRHKCDADSGFEVVFVYSFGPNLIRDSSRSEILGDDVGSYLVRETQ